LPPVSACKRLDLILDFFGKVKPPRISPLRDHGVPSGALTLDPRDKVFGFFTTLIIPDELKVNNWIHSSEERENFSVVQRLSEGFGEWACQAVVVASRPLKAVQEFVGYDLDLLLW
jgi:hypothetical protein